MWMCSKQNHVQSLTEQLTSMEAQHLRESGHHRMCVDRRIRFEYATLNSERKSCGLKNIQIRAEGTKKTTTQRQRR